MLFLCSLHLCGIQIVVAALFGHELLVIAGFQDAALTNKEDAVAALDGGETVGNDEAGAPLEQGFDALLEETLGLGIDGGSGLVQDDGCC